MRPLTVTMFLLMIIPVVAPAQSLRLVRAGYTVSIARERSGDIGFFPVVMGRLDTLSRANASKRFGILYRGLGSTADTYKGLEILDASSDAALVSLSPSEIAGGTVSGASVLPDRSFSNDSMIVTSYELDQGGRTMILRYTRSLKSDASLPKGTGMGIEWAIESPTAMSLRGVFKGPVEGQSRLAGSSLIVEPDTSTSRFIPAIVVSGGASTQPTLTGTADRIAAFDGPVVSVQAGTMTPVLSLTVTGTTVTAPGYIREQASILAARLTGSAPSPRMITLTSVSSPMAQSGDTLTYRILFHNIGTSPAVDVVLNNPISDGLRYIRGTATGDDADITFSETSPEPPQQPAVRGITWTFLSNILPGDERWTSFNVIVQ